MKSTIELFKALLVDISSITNTSTERDFIYIKSRIEHEGLSFVTITLPSFAKDFERSIELGRVDQSLFKPFSKKKTSKGVEIPKLFSGILSKVFDADGVVQPCIDSSLVDCIRQVCLVFNKLKKECTQERQSNAIIAYKQCERDLSEFRPKAWFLFHDFVKLSNLLFGRVFADIELLLESRSLVPKHGPGAVAERFSLNEKYSRQTWGRRLERSFPVLDYAVPNYGYSVDEVLVGDFEPNEEQPVRVVFVPKTQKSPRVIAIEPCHNQYAQQALLKELVFGIENNPLTRGIHFTSSDLNRSYALKSSKTREFATLDLSEASDRVHAGLAFHLFSGFPRLAAGVFDSRSKSALLPDNSIVKLKKFASMGSALCFPIESMVFFTLCVLSGFRYTGLSLSTKNLENITSQIHVFGDDLIVPTQWYDTLTNVLTSACFKVNLSKSFAKSSFRESCGVDAYNGDIVTPVYVRRELPRSKRDAQSVVSTVSSANQFYKKGFWNTCKYLRAFVEKTLRTSLPQVASNSESLGWHSFRESSQIQRWNPTLHRFEFRGLLVKPRFRKDEVVGAARLLKYFLRKSNNLDPLEMRDFNKSTVRESVCLKTRWIAL